MTSTENPSDHEGVAEVAAELAAMQAQLRAGDAGDGRRRAILEAALELLAEQGYAGASLRKVAARVGIAQPSLYHYFATKEELVEQVLDTFAHDMFTVIDPQALPASLVEVPRFCVEGVFAVYAKPTHAQFVRVAFAVSRVNPRYGRLMRTIFVDQVALGLSTLMRPFVAAGEIDADEAMWLCRMCINALGLKFMEERVLFDPREPSDELRRYAEFVIGVAESYLRRR